MVDTTTTAQRAHERLVRASESVRRRGLADTAKLAKERAVFLHEAHIWYELDLTRDRPRREMPEGLALVEGGADQMHLLEQLPSLSQEEAHDRAERGASLWFVLADARPAFACWTFPRSAPALAAPTGWFSLPERVHCLEDSVTSPDFRGRGVAPAAWTAVMDRLRERGVASLITKVAIENVASCRAVGKAGFVHAATMTLTRLGPRVRVQVDHAGTGVGPHLRQQLAH
jgi:GNAT superfamily N-acetyltransferase